MSLISWKWVKSCFNSTAWYEAAKDHAQKAAPVIGNTSKGIVLANVVIVGAALAKSEKVQNAVKAPGKVAQTYIETPIQKWGEKTYHTIDTNISSDSKMDLVVVADQTSDNQKPLNIAIPNNATLNGAAAGFLGEVVTGCVTVVGAALVGAGLYAASNAATNIGKAIVLDRSKSAVKEAASKSWEDTKAICHGVVAVGDLLAGAVCYLIVDELIGAGNQAADRLPHDEATDMAGADI